MRLHRTTEVAKALGVTRRTVTMWESRGVLRAIRIGNPNVRHFAFGEIEILAAALARDLRRRGFKLPQVVAIVNWLRTQTLESFQQQWHRGRTLLFCVGANEPFPSLLCRADIFDRPEIDLPAALAAGVAVAVIDTQEAYLQLTAKLGEGIEIEEPHARILCEAAAR